MALEEYFINKGVIAAHIAAPIAAGAFKGYCAAKGIDVSPEALDAVVTWGPIAAGSLYGAGIGSLFGLVSHGGWTGLGIVGGAGLVAGTGAAAALQGLSYAVAYTVTTQLN